VTPSTLPERLGIAGSGAIACGLAAVASASGEVALWARSDASAERAGEEIARACDQLAGEADASRVTVTTELSGLHDASYVLEAIVEDPDHKAELLGSLGAALEDSAILATTTSSLSIARLAEASGRPDRFAGFHPFNPVPRMKLVELAFPAAAGEPTRRRSLALCEALGKTAVEVPDVRGFVVNRLLFPYLFDAVRLMESTGLAAEDIDTAMKLGAGMPMGPLALLDMVGLDVAAAIGDSIEAEVPRTIRELVAQDALGRKTGRGLLAYETAKSS
jgi:3-hydroxybutyryl-CoA dehydrogenase